MDKKFLLLVDIEATLQARIPGVVWYVIQEVEYDHPNAITAVDVEAAVDFCDQVLNINPNFIV